MAQENTTDYWMNKGQELFEDASFEESLQAYNEVLQIDPENSSAWLSIAKTLGVLGNGNESSKAYEKALNLIDRNLKRNPQDASAWQAKSDALIGLGRQEEALRAQENALEAYSKSIEINPAFSLAWHGRSLAQRELGSIFDADQSLYVARKLGYEEM
jgi:tetratricopeptide (TPR) repeat protein